MLKIRFLKAGLILLLISCTGRNRIQSRLKDPPVEKLNVSNGKNATNKILFLTLRMTLTDSAKDTYKFTVINTIFAEGILNKNSFNHTIPIEAYNLYCEITDESKKRVELVKVQNPLLRVFEYSPDKGILGKELIKSNTGELYLRFQLTKDSKFLTIYKPQPDLQTLKKIYYAQI
jgi:hypothetical protein